MSYEREVALASRLINAKGASVALTRTTPGGYDPITGSSGAVTLTASGRAIARRPTGADAERIKQLDLVSLTTVVLLIAAAGLAFAPRPVDVVTWGGETYTVRDVVPLNVDGAAPILYTVFASR